MLIVYYILQLYTFDFDIFSLCTKSIIRPKLAHSCWIMNLYYFEKLFSATQSDDVDELARLNLTDPIYINVHKVRVLLSISAEAFFTYILQFCFCFCFVLFYCDAKFEKLIFCP